MSQPWWYSGGEAEPPQRPRLDLGALAGTAMSIVELARTALLAPHAAHADPAEHPECLLCRATQAMSTPPVAREARTVTWIELDAPDAGSAGD